MRHHTWILILPLLGAALSARGLDVAPVFQKHCAGCHGKDGEGHTKFARKHKVPDFASPRFQSHQSDAKIRHAIEFGVSGTKMHGYKSRLSPQEIDGLLAYIRSLKRG